MHEIEVRRIEVRRTTITTLVAAALVALAACGDDVLIDAESAYGRSVFGVDAANNLVVFGTENPGRVLRTTAIAGLQGGEQVVGLDFRPADGQLYAMTSASRLYVLDTLSARATVVTTLPLPALSGASFGFDFNPVADRIRVHSDTRQNLRLPPSLVGTAVVDTALAYQAGDPGAGAPITVVGSAYTNSAAGATTTTLSVIDASRDALLRSPSPNGGTLSTVGGLNVSTSEAVGFDIGVRDGLALAALTDAGRSRLYRIDLTTGAATLVGTIGSGVTLRGLAIAP